MHIKSYTFIGGTFVLGGRTFAMPGKNVIDPLHRREATLRDTQREIGDKFNRNRRDETTDVCFSFPLGEKLERLFRMKGCGPIIKAWVFQTAFRRVDIDGNWSFWDARLLGNREWIFPTVDRVRDDENDTDVSKRIIPFAASPNSDGKYKWNPVTETKEKEKFQFFIKTPYKNNCRDKSEDHCDMIQRKRKNNDC